MLLDKTRFAISAFLEEHFETFHREIHALREEDFTPWTDSLACTKPWLCVPLFSATPPTVIKVDWERQERLMPETIALLRSRPELTMAGISILLEEGHIHPHIDVKEDGIVRAHLGLQIPKESAIRLCGELVRWKEGEAIVIEGGVDHEAANLSKTPRIVLLIDFQATPEEWAYIKEEMKDIDPRWLIGGVGLGLFTDDELRSGRRMSRELPAEVQTA